MSNLFKGRSGSFISDSAPPLPPVPHGHGASSGGHTAGYHERDLQLLVAETDDLMDKLRAAEALRKSEPISIFTLQPIRLRNWRIRRQDSAITTSFESLFPRLVKSVEDTTILASEIDEKTVALWDQACVLKIRLNACICHNTEYLANKAGMVEEMRRVVDALSAYSTEIKSMITFNVEVIRQRLVQTVSQGRSFVSWGSRAMLMRPISETELGEDRDHNFLMQKLRFIRESKEDLMVKLTDLLELRELHTANLEAATAAYTDICDLIESVNESMSLPRPSEATVVVPLQYDHSTCPDCSIIHTMAEQCIDHLSSLIRQQEDVRAWCDALSTAKAKVEEAKVEIQKFYDLQAPGSDTVAISTADDAVSDAQIAVPEAGASRVGSP